MAVYLIVDALKLLICGELVPEGVDMVRRLRSQQCVSELGVSGARRRRRVL